MADELFYDGMEGPAIRKTLNDMYTVWLAALEEAIGPRGWSPAFGIASDGERRVLQIVDWVGGEDEKPTVTGYIGAAGLVPTATEAIDIRGGQGIAGNDGNDGANGPANTLTIGTVQSGATAGAEITGTAPSQTLNLTLPKGDAGSDGADGTDGWTPVWAAVADGERRVLRIDDWTGGTGTKPATGYLGPTGIVATIGDALDIRGAPGSGSVSTVNDLDPDGAGNVSLGISDIPNLLASLDEKVDKVTGKGLSSNDYTTTEKSKLAGVASGATNTAAPVNADWNAASGLAAIQNKPTIPVIPGNATPSAAGLMSGADKSKLDDVATQATKNATDAQLRDRSTHTGTQASSTITGLAAVATTGSYADLSGKPTIPTLAPIADTADIASLSGSDTITPGSLGTAAAAAGTISGGASITFNWSAAVNYTMALTGNRTLPNPTSVLPGSTRVIVVSSSTSTSRTLAFGSNFVGDLPTVAVTNTSNMVLFLYAISATKIVVSGVEI